MQAVELHMTFGRGGGWCVCQDVPPAILEKRCPNLGTLKVFEKPWFTQPQWELAGV